MKLTLNTVIALVAINILIFFASQSIQLNELLALYFPENPNFAPWQLVTHMFMHADMMHLLFNMFALWMFGTQLQPSIRTDDRIWIATF